MGRPLQIAGGLVLLLLAAPHTAVAESRTIAVLEFRAGARGMAGISSAMARRLEQLTAHRAVGPEDARKRLGPGLDAAVARCKGRTACVAALGRRLGCQEVILVGISQLGDLILAVQRIDVERGRVLTRLADSRAADTPLRDEDVDRYLRQLLPAEDFLRYGRLTVTSDRAGDEVWVDGELRGRTPLQPLTLAAPGRYAVQVRRPGHQEFRASLQVLPDANAELRATLTPSGGGKWYTQWWVWALVGGAAVAGATVAGVLASQASPDQVPAVLQLP